MGPQFHEGWNSVMLGRSVDGDGIPAFIPSHNVHLAWSVHPGIGMQAGNRVIVERFDQIAGNAISAHYATLAWIGRLGPKQAAVGFWRNHLCGRVVRWVTVHGCLRNVVGPSADRLRWPRCLRVDPCRPCASSSPSPDWTATTEVRKLSPELCGTRAWKWSIPASGRLPSKS